MYAIPADGRGTGESEIWSSIVAKNKSLFVCQECGAQRQKWEGRCNECGAWNSLVEEKIIAPLGKASGRGWTIGNSESDSSASGLRAYRLNETFDEGQAKRQSTGIGELDRVLGGGLVSGSYTLLGGDPGIGKSTLLLQMAGGLANEGSQILYVSGEESVPQTALRARRLGIQSEKVAIASESRLEHIIALARSFHPEVLVVDSIQTVYLADIPSAPGSVSQVRECASQLMSLAKSSNMAVLIIGHVTKEGNIAGPKTLEHMVDTVLSFEGDNNHQFRLLRALKNRFGATNELGVFQMASQGMTEVTNPSELFLEERGADLIGSSVFTAMEGSRPLLCEVQALASYSPMAMPRRTSIGFDLARIHLLVAVLDKHLNSHLHQNDVFVNIVGGLRLTEPAADLAVAASLISSIGQQELDPRTCFFGEIGLTGEIRAASLPEERIREALKLGFMTFVLPESNRKHVAQQIKEKKDPLTTFKFVKHIRDLERVIGKRTQAASKNGSSEKVDPKLLFDN